MLVTITTDASFYSEYKQGGFAFWITSNLGRIRYAGAFKDTILTPSDAEFKCIINALHILNKQGWAVTEIYINTDSKNVIDAIENKTKTLPQYAQDNLKTYNKLIKLINVPNISLRHVKAHLHTKTARHWVNDWCDIEAKKAARKKIFGE
jgi:ribonuclease HI